MGLISAMTIIPNFKAGKRFIGKHVKIVFFLKYHLLHEDNFLAHLWHVTYVISFNMCSDLGAKLANL